MLTDQGDFIEMNTIPESCRLPRAPRHDCKHYKDLPQSSYILSPNDKVQVFRRALWGGLIIAWCLHGPWGRPSGWKRAEALWRSNSFIKHILFTLWTFWNSVPSCLLLEWSFILYELVKPTRIYVHRCSKGSIAETMEVHAQLASM